jgi:hypothetical protein
MGIIGRVFGKSHGKSDADNEKLAADRARMTASATPGPLQTSEEIAQVRQHMEAELDAQRLRRTEGASPQA